MATKLNFANVWVKGVLIVFGLLVVVNILFVAVTNDYPPYSINVDDEGNIPVLLSAVIFLSILVPLISLMVRELCNQRRLRVLMGLTLSIFSVLTITIDEVFTFHEFVVTPLVRENFLCPIFDICHAGRLWIVLYFPIGILVAICLFDLFRILDPKGMTRRWALYGVVAFLLVILLEASERLWTPYPNFVQEFVEVFGAMAFFRVFAHLAYEQRSR